MDFRVFLLLQERQQVDPATLQSLEQGFHQALEKLIARTRDPVLRVEFEKMRSCPIRDARGRCNTFTDYLLGTLIRRGCHGVDYEDAMQYAFIQLASPVNLNGKPKSTAFDIDESRPYNPGDNPCEARFKTSVGRLAMNVCGGKVPRLKAIHRPAGTISIGQGRGEQGGRISPDEIPGEGDDTRELLGDILSLLQQQQPNHPEIPLVDLFHSMMRGDGTRPKFGRQAADAGRKIIRDVIRQYAISTDNRRLLSMIDPKPKQPKPPRKPDLPPDERDYRSIVSVMARNEQRATLSILGKARRRWLEWAPRDPGSPHPNRLADVLANMVRDGVLVEKKTRAGGRVFLPGTRYEEFLGEPVAA